MKRILLVSVMLAAMLLSACGATVTTPEPTSTLLYTIEGTGDGITPVFVVKGAEGKPIEFEVKWEAVPEDAFFSLSVHFASVNNPVIEGNPYKVMKGSIPVSFSHPNPFASKGEFVIEVIASSKCKWVIEIYK